MERATSILLHVIDQHADDLVKLRAEVRQVMYPLNYIDVRLLLLVERLRQTVASFRQLPSLEADLVEVDEPEIDFSRPPWEGRG